MPLPRPCTSAIWKLLLAGAVVTGPPSCNCGAPPGGSGSSSTRVASSTPPVCTLNPTSTSSPAVSAVSELTPWYTVELLVVYVVLTPLGGCTTSVVPVAETTVPLCSWPVPLLPIGGGAAAGGTGFRLNTGV